MVSSTLLDQKTELYAFGRQTWAKLTAFGSASRLSTSPNLPQSNLKLSFPKFEAVQLIYLHFISKKKKISLEKVRLDSIYNQ
jgi:hypothetical protein